LSSLGAGACSGLKCHEVDLDQRDLPVQRPQTTLLSGEERSTVRGRGTHDLDLAPEHEALASQAGKPGFERGPERRHVAVRRTSTPLDHRRDRSPCLSEPLPAGETVAFRRVYYEDDSASL